VAFFLQGLCGQARLGSTIYSVLLGQSLVPFLYKDILSSMLLEKVVSESLKRTRWSSTLLSLYLVILSIAKYSASTSSGNKIYL